MRVGLAGCMLLLAFQAVSAHDYGEFAPLSPALRGALIAVLEDAVEAGWLAGDRSGQPGLVPLPDALDRETRGRLASALRQRVGVDNPARLPVNVLLPLFHDLAGFRAAFEAHGHGMPNDPAAAADYRRLQAIIDRIWAR